MRELTPLEARVLGVLFEKALTVPDSYPLSMNAVVLGCNQKTARDPVMNASEADVQTALEALKALNLVFERSGSRVTKYEHNIARTMALPGQSVALLVTLILRGPQTSAELRGSTERLHRFADVSSVEGFLVELAERSEDKGGPLVVKLPRASGAREARWAHLMCGADFPVASASGGDGEDLVAISELAAFKARQAEMTDEIQSLRDLVERLYAELGIAQNPNG
jgi:uncharacterized protein